MNKNWRTLICLVGLLVLVFSVVQGATPCPSDCTCLSPSAALKMGYKTYCGGKQIICDYDLAKNPLYCYQNPLPTTTTKPTYPTCSEGCLCLNAADAKAKGYAAYCSGKQTLCGYDSQQNPLYCYAQPVPTTTPVTYPKCPSGCYCINAADAKGKGYTAYCDGKQTLCGYDANQNPQYCYVQPVGTTVTPATIAPPPCPSSSMCMYEADAKAKGYSPFGGKLTICAYDYDKNPLYCFEPKVITTAPPPCPSGCTCQGAEKAKEAGYMFCGGTGAICGYDAAKNPLYCIGPIPTTTSSQMPTVPTMTGTAERTVAPGKEATPAVRTEEGFFSPIFRMIFGPSCAEGETWCMDGCVDLQSSEIHCGACDVPCASTQICQDGACRIVAGEGGIDNCPLGWIPCGQQCYNPLVSEAHCGDCGTVCPEGYTCMAGTCCSPEGCPFGTIYCYGSCVDVMRSERHCGYCSNISCDSTESCVNGVCTVIGEAGGDCRSDWLVCGGTCTNPMNDPVNCGACGNVCPPDRECQEGRCVCSAGMTECNRLTLATGLSGVATAQKGWGTYCANLQTDVDNCGACGNACRPDQVCQAGRCTCSDVTDPCNGLCVNIRFDPDHCGGCNRPCTDPSNPDCCYGQCTNIQTDENNCGACRMPGMGCPEGSSCCNGICVNTRTNIRHCGGCNQFCAAEGVCCNGTCHVPALDTVTDPCTACGNPCNPESERCCDGECVNILNNDNNCGMCGRACWGEDGVCCNGHCRNLRGDSSSCGVCGNACPYWFSCANYKCCFWGNPSLCLAQVRRMDET